MSRAAKASGIAVIALGLSTLVWAVLSWEPQRWPVFAGYLVAALAASALRIRLPGITGYLSLHFFFVLLALAQLGAPQAVAIATAGALLQSFLWDPPDAGRYGAALNVAATVLATAASALTYQAMGASGLSGRSPLMPVVAAGFFFLAASVPQAMLAARGQPETVSRVWRKSYFWTLPHYVAGGGLAGLLGLLEIRAGWQTALLIVPLLYWMYHSYRYYLQQADEERRQVREMAGLQFRTIEALALAIEGHDVTKHGHLQRVGIYVMEIGRQMRLTEPEQQALYAAAMLHDIGKLAVPEHIITKPGRLTDVEFERMKVHPTAGAEILEKVRFPYPVAPVVLAHHEKWDGSGYPQGLKGEAIPVAARILAAVDCLDALLSDRYHRRALPLDRAISYLESESGKSFDPHVVRIIVERHRELEARVRAEADAPQAVASPLLASPDLSVATAGASPAGTEFLARIAAARREEQDLFHLTRELGNSLSLDETLTVCGDRIKSMCPYDSIAIYLRRDDKLVAEFAAGEESWVLGTLEIPPGQGLAGWVAENRTPVLNGDPAEDLAVSAKGASSALGSALAVPLESHNGVVGVLSLYARRKEAFTADHLRVLAGVSTKAALALENALRFSQAEHSATTDMLTNLPNARSLFLHLDSELSRARRTRETLAVLVCDLDGFKDVNDRLGHIEGNRVLRDVGQVLRRQCREYDMVARMGGDEFVVVLSGYRDSSLEPKISQLTQAVAECARQSGTPGLGISIGSACFPEDGADAEALLAEADRRMYEVKQQRSTQARHTRHQMAALDQPLDGKATIQ